MSYPNIIILISGKRKCGKDYISEKLQSLIGTDACIIVRISEPIKSHYAKENKLNLDELMSENPYKEQYRQAMIKWSDDVRKENPGYFCKAACEKAATKMLWIVSDIRRKTDIKWFRETYSNKIKTVRINADDEVRTKRGWTFTQGVDDVASECDLDDFTEWDMEIYNNDDTTFQEGLQKLLQFIMGLC